MDKNSKEAYRQPVSPYLLRPLREFETARLENLDRKSGTDGRTPGADAGSIKEEALRTARMALPEMSPTAVSAAVEHPRKTG